MKKEFCTECQQEVVPVISVDNEFDYIWTCPNCDVREYNLGMIKREAQ